MYSHIYDTKKLLNLQLENKEINKDEYNFINFYWNSIRADYLSTVAKRSLWIPHIGELTIKYNPLKVLIIRKIRIVRKLRNKGKLNTKVETELKQLLIIRNEIATERYNNQKRIQLLSRKH